MRTLVVTEPGAELRVHEGYCLVLRGKAELQRIRLSEISRILLFGPVQPSTAILSWALRAGADLVFFDGTGRCRGRLVGPRSGNVALRLAQLRFLDDPEKQLELARRIVEGKIRNQRALLLRAQRERPERDLALALYGLREDLAALSVAPGLDHVRGCEGSAASRYFQVFGRLILDSRFPFGGRTRRPPLDAVNACLSFGYALLQGRVDSLAERVGLDPMIGALHEPRCGRPSLSLDLMEEWRPALIDALVLRLLNRRQLSPFDFGPPERDEVERVFAEDPRTATETEDEEPSPEGIYLRPPARKILIRAFQRRLRDPARSAVNAMARTYEDALEAQVHHLGRVLLGSDSQYLPFLLR
ncbi:MAG: CRISPR-associated endonuclease Cas1 [Planctomycetes bacterium]|nr:CRISPR-associated endonuclease Cas1 [Planctomycetota bacterium]